MTTQYEDIFSSSNNQTAATPTVTATSTAAASTTTATPPSTPHDVEIALTEVNDLKCEIGKIAKAIIAAEKDVAIKKEALAKAETALKRRKEKRKSLRKDLKKAKKTAGKKFKSVMTSFPQED